MSRQPTSEDDPGQIPGSSETTVEVRARQPTGSRPASGARPTGGAGATATTVSPRPIAGTRPKRARAASLDTIAARVRPLEKRDAGGRGPSWSARAPHATPTRDPPRRRGARHHLPIVQREHYGMGRELGRGGLGRVTEARDDRLERSVAIKELLAVEPMLQARFLREAMITARLQHPSIVPVYEAGYWPDGAPFYAMKLIDGRTIAELLDDADSLERRLVYLPNAIAVADAIAYAHSQRIIHRDLKPSNIIIGEFGETMVVDWGLAKDLDAVTRDGPSPPGLFHQRGEGLTEFGSVMGTPSYMPPEQAQGAELVDERSDIYALGAMLYHMVAGAAPYRGTTAAEILEQLDRGECPPLTARVPTAPGDLVAIVERAMSRDPDQRYQTARYLAEDLRRFQSGQRVSVHQYSFWALLTRFVRRHRAVVTVASVLLLALLVTAVFSFEQVIAERNVARDHAREAQRAQARTQERSEQLTVAQAALGADPTASVAWLATLPEEAGNWMHAWLVAVGARNQGIARHVWRSHGGVLRDLRLSPDGRILASASQAGTIELRDLETGDTTLLQGHTSWVYRIAFSPAQPLLASAGRDGTVRLWDLQGRLVETVESLPDRVYTVAFSPDGAYLAAGDRAGRVYLRDMASGATAVWTGHGAAITEVAFAPDAALLATGDDDGGLTLWRPRATLERAAPQASEHLEGHDDEISTLAFAPGGDVLASASADGTVRLWPIASSAPPLSAGPDPTATVLSHGSEVDSIAFSPDGAHLASTSANGAVRLWNLADGATGQGRILGHHDGRAEIAVFSPDGHTLASSGYDGLVRLWDVATGHELRRYVGHQTSVWRLVFSRDGKTLWSGGRRSNNGIRQWELAEPTARRFVGPDEGIYGLAWSPDGRHVATAHSHGAVVLWDMERNRGATVVQHEGLVYGLAFTGDGRHLVSAGHDGAVQVRDLASTRTVGRTRRLGVHRDRVHDLTLSGDGRLAATASADGTIGLWELTTGDVRWLRGHGAAVAGVVFSPDGRQVLSECRDGEVWLWDLEHGSHRILDRRSHSAWQAISFSPDGELAAWSGDDNTVRLWHRRTGATRALRGHQRGITGLRFSPQSTRLLSLAQHDQVALLWDLATHEGRALEVPGALSAAFSQDGENLATTGEDGTVRLWHLESGASHIVHQYSLAADTIAFSPDGKHLSVGDRRRMLHVWDVGLPAEPGALGAWLKQVTSAAIAPGTLVAASPPMARSADGHESSGKSSDPASPLGKP